MTKRAWLAKFQQQVTENLDQAEAEEILACVAGGENLSRLRKARCIAGALARLESCADEAVVADILQGCACEFSTRRIAAVKRVYDGSSDMADFWARLRESGLLGRDFELRDGWVVMAKGPYRPDLKARYPDDPFEWFCHCGSIVKPLHGRLSPAICNCGVGFLRPLFTALFGAPVDMEVRQSLVKGDARCVFAVKVPASKGVTP
jgi:hypothetical protein